MAASSSAADAPLGRVCMDGNSHLVLRRLAELASADARRAAAAARDDDGRTPLHWAASFCSRDVVRALCDAGADVAQADASGWTPLHIAASAGHDENVAELLYRSAAPRAVTPKGLTPLHYAASKGHTDVGRLLLEHGAEVNARDGAKQCAIHRAASNGKDAFIRMLYSPPALKVEGKHEKTRVNPADRLGNTPLHLALDSGHGSTAVLLIEECGADRERQNVDGVVPEELPGVGGQEQRKLLDYLRSVCGPREG